MKHITGIDRHQTFITSLELHISDQNPVRFVDAFVAHIDLLKLGFQLQTLNTEGSPIFETKIFLKTTFMPTSMACAAAAK